MEGEGRVRGLFGREERCSERERERGGGVRGGGGGWRATLASTSDTKSIVLI